MAAIKLEIITGTSAKMKRAPRHPEIQGAIDRMKVGQSFLDKQNLHPSTIYLYAKRAGKTLSRKGEKNGTRYTRTA